MKSFLPKVLHKLNGRPLIRWVLSAVAPLKPGKSYIVVGHDKKQVCSELSKDKVIFVEQKKQLGSGHALKQVERYLKRYKGNILVLCGDVPLIQKQTLSNLVSIHKKQNNAATILSSMIDNPFSYGRIYRLPSGQVRGIIEEKDATDRQREIKEINSGIYCFSSPVIWDALKKIKSDNKKKEYYLTDAISFLSDMGENIGAYPNAKFEEILGINNRADLARAEKIVRGNILKNLMLNGVTIVDPENTYVSSQAKIGTDTVIFPGTVIEGKTSIGKNCRIGPYSYIKDSVLADNVEVVSSYIYSSSISKRVKIGPFSHLRPGTKVKEGAKVGNFSETKNSTIGAGSKVNHLSYIGDSYLGKHVNIGAGTITCNYDGVKKYKTIIGDRSFVGSNVNFVAPVKIGPETLIGAGSTITNNVPKKHMAIARARQVNKVKKKK